MGKVTFVGGKVGMTEPVIPVTTIPASSIAVGSSVYLMENGSPVEYLVVNQGKPSNSSLYGSSCKGTWLLRKDIYNNRVWDSDNDHNYANSDINKYLNSTFFNLFDTKTQEAIRQVPLPYYNGSSVASGASGTYTKVFLLGCYELGWTTSNWNVIPVDGACLSYFKNTSEVDSKRIAYLNGKANIWWTRSSNINVTNGVMQVPANGDLDYDACQNSFGIRPALVVPSTALFDEKTLVLMGV